IYAGYQLTNGELFKIGDITVKGESRLDTYYFRNRVGVNNYEMEWTTKIYLTLTDRLFFNVTHSAYAYREATGRWSWVNELLVGLNVLFDRRIPFIY
ncbi:hypothetical protein KJ865_08010, partial [Myxococcota bacterium]|nr:hypothetical protein [Myxococcota bacterium]